ncbi:hypothetical protein ASPVEDRAFT_39091 [Aspergillus versicolor CBS 583.65]|uniref:Actin-like ATPase domain-containing protein n=1 Tax=Aspergillus versicolor CBS 583.65 TaxID=1036611 RepID=A0A1L9PE37_ASPVE|nr:uncharacterized protein ASPVEDRAFT_39091 [Aspergillus versicolor CBS 583.65]OJI99714.1 hypothetical protein ASPVEDRAFT_39091 [Aspergillus versicolor CBS 583.65]
MDNNKHKHTSLIIIGIDFGSTSSSAAFNRPNSSTEIHILHHWPDAVKWSFDQVPRGAEIQSIVYYSPDIEVVGWSGLANRDEVVTAQGNLKPGIHPAPDFKAQLFPPTEAQPGLLPRGKTIEDITVDFLCHLRRSIQEQLAWRDCRGTLQFMMTVPAFWDDETREKFRGITKTAGFGQGEKLELISSLEAALFNAHYAMPTFNAGDNILVLDCGGHLVEAAVYQVKSTSPLKIDRRTSVSVASCGSAEVTRQFMTIAGNKINKAGFPDHGRTKPRMRLRAKRAFEKDLLFGDVLGRPEFKFDLPPEVLDGFWVADLGVEMDCPEANILEGYMVFSEDEIYPCFDAAVERTLGLVREQVDAMHEQNEQIQGCLLVGGFNRCHYYNRNVKSGISESGGTIEVNNRTIPFAKGAILAGLDRLNIP